MKLKTGTIFKFAILFYLTFGVWESFTQNKYSFQDSDLNIEERIDDLLKRLTLEEKASMMLNNSPAIDRLNIPAYDWWNESLHGVGRAGKATVFPQAIGLAATFDEDLIFRISTAISDEARAKHNAARAKGSTQRYTGLSFWSPNVNIFRDPRWGRGQETYGEDPYLTSIIGVNYVNGLQGSDPKYLKTAACAKHFVVHSGPEKLRHSFNAIPDDRDFHETYLPAFKALVDAGVETVMCAYNQVYDEPCCGSGFLLEELLRKQWQFKGHVVSDCGALNDFVKHQKIVENKTDAAVMAVNAGVNLNCGQIYKHIPDAVRMNKISEEEIDKILKPLLRTRFKLGLLDTEENSPYSLIKPEIINSPAHQKLAHEAAVKSIVLLKNDHNTLPINLNTIQKIFVTGPTASDNSVLLGNYNGLSGNLVTLLEGMINKVDAGTVVDYTMGTLLNTNDVYHGIHHAASSDVIIASIGNSRLLEGEQGDAMLSSSGGDRAAIKLPQNQIEFIRRLKKRAPDKPLIVVINGGSAVAIPEISKLADAVLFVWYPGEQGGNAIADIIVGNNNPSGKLPVTFYADLNDLPPFDDYSMKNRTYKYFKGTPLYPFGHGLSYSTFSFVNIKSIQHRKSEEIEIKFSITNTSNREGEEVVQLYVQHPESQLNKPLKSLKGFKRVLLKPEESKEISFITSINNLALWDTENEKFSVVKGKYVFQVGVSSSDVKLSKEVEIEGITNNKK